MHMRKYESLKDKLCEALSEIADKPELSAGDLEVVHKLTDTIKNIDKIMMLEDDDGYSGAGDWEARGRFGDRYPYDENGSSYANRRGSHYVRGHYSRANGRGDMRDGRVYRGGYSRDSEKDEILDDLSDMLEKADSRRIKDMIRDVIKAVREED